MRTGDGARGIGGEEVRSYLSFRKYKNSTIYTV
jgi:hypothetical protein